MIGTLTFSSPSSPSSTKTILEDLPRWIFRCRTGFFCLVPRKTFNVRPLHFDSAQNRVLKPFRPSFSLKASQVNLDAAEIQVQEKYATKTVHVRFQLQKQCVFGEHFFIVGDDPVFGLWDPENAIPLNWSDGHVWTVDLDLPVGKSIEFKFILKGKTGKILWQPGPNRALETWGTSNTIVICEDWENAELQRISEEEMASVNQEGQQSFVFNSEMPIVAENVTSGFSKEDIGPDANNSSTVTEKEIKVVGTVQENPTAIVAENIGFMKDDSEVDLSSDVPNEIKMENCNEAPVVRDGNATEGAMVSHQEDPVLVPGLTPLSALEKEASGSEHEETSSAHASAEAMEEKADKFPELDKKQESEGETKKEEQPTERSLLNEKEEEEVNGVVQRRYAAEAEEERKPPQTELWESDMQWGRRTLHKLLNSFGLL